MQSLNKQKFARDTNGIRQVDETALSCTKNRNGTDDCNFGYYCTIGACQCRSAPEGFVEYCSGFVITDCFCITLNEAENGVQFGACIIFPYACAAKKNASKYGVPNQYFHDYCQNLGRTGTLCGSCLPDYYPLAYSFDLNCIPCPNARWNWVWYIMAAYLPLTLFYFVLVLLKINVVSSLFNPVVFFSQVMSISRSFLRSVRNDSDASVGIRILLTLYGVWNLDFFRPYYSDLCLGIGILPTLALDHAIAVYPLITR